MIGARLSSLTQRNVAGGLCAISSLPLLVPFAIFGEPVPWSFALPAVVCVPASTILARRAGVQMIPSALPLGLGIGLFATSALVSIATTGLVSAAFLETLGASFILSWAAALCDAKAGLAAIVALTTAAAVAMFGLTLRSNALPLLGKILVPQAGRAQLGRPSEFAFIFHPNEVGVLAAIAFSGWLALHLLTTSAPARVLTTIGLCFGGSLVVLSQSHSSWVAVVFGTIVAFGSRQRTSRQAITTPLAISVLALLGLLAAITLDDQLLYQAAADLRQRIDIWGTVLSVAVKVPLGNGVNSFQTLGFSPYVRGPHNSLIAIWLDFGVGGVVAAAFLCARTYWVHLKRASTSAVSLGLVTMMSSLIVLSIPESTIVVSLLRFTDPPSWSGYSELIFPLAFCLWGIAESVDSHRLSAQSPQAAAMRSNNESSRGI